MDASEVYDAYGRAYERFNVQGANPDPVTDAVGPLAQFGQRSEEEDRAAVAARYVRQIDGELYDPATGRRIKSQTALSGNALADRISNGVTDPLRLTGQIAAGAFKGAASNFAFGLFAGDPSLRPRTYLEYAGKEFGQNTGLLIGLTSSGRGISKAGLSASSKGAYKFVPGPAASKLEIAAAEEASQGFSSFRKFKAVYGPAGEGLEWHHIVEQGGGNVERFGAEAIHSPKNLRPIPVAIHRKISGHYSSKPLDLNGLTVRQWLRQRSWEDQYTYGIEYMKTLGIRE